jgi:hypothetical protein
MLMIIYRPLISHEVKGPKIDMTTTLTPQSGGAHGSTDRSSRRVARFGLQNRAQCVASTDVKKHV